MRTFLSRPWLVLAVTFEILLLPTAFASTDLDSPVIRDVKANDEDKKVDVITSVERAADSDPVTVRPIDFSITHEKIHLSGDEQIGLTGFNLHVHDDTGFFAGVGSYFATTGHRGGFIGIGVDGGYTYTAFDKLRLTPSLFVGGAGGVGVSNFGGGLFLRPAFALDYDFRYFFLGGGVSYIWAPNGTTSSPQPFAKISVPYDLLISDFSFGEREYPQYPKSVNMPALTYRKYRVGPSAMLYSTPGSLTNTSGKSLSRDIALAGVSVQHFFLRDFFADFGLYGAMYGNVKGYLSMMGGVGYSYSLIDRTLYVEPRLDVGMGGGGNTNVAGGVATQPAVNLTWEVTDDFYFSGGTGYLYTFGGNFHFQTYNFGLGTHFDALETKERTYETRRGFAPSSHEKSNWKVSLASTHYYFGNQASDDVDLLDIGFRYFVAQNFSIDGTGMWPYLGKANGYASGLIGPTFESKIFGPMGVLISVAAGPAAGGGLPVGDGVLFAGNAGLTYNVYEDLSLYATYGRQRYLQGVAFASLTAGLNYAFGIPQSRHHVLRLN